MNLSILTVEIRYEHDVVLARQRARQIAEALGFERQDQVRLATAVSELARNAFQYAGGGKVEFSVKPDRPQLLQARVSDTGRGIPNLEEILNGSYVSETGMGLGIIGAKRLMDEFKIVSTSGGAEAVVAKFVPSATPLITQKTIGKLVQDLARTPGQDPFAEMQRQNQELLATMAELEKNQRELSELNRELEDTNRGVVALYAELDQRADYLRRVSESKTRFLSNMTHEFRTPLNSIISLSRMLTDKLDGDLTPEQEKQVSYIRSAAGDLTSLVNDLLDISKVEAGKVSVRPDSFELAAIFNSLRGTLRPLLAQNSSVNLVFEDPDEIPTLFTDESKLSQILRNFISNALKYTNRGEVRVTAEMDGPEHVLISVADTGIGIAPENQARIFEEFEQVEGDHQLKSKGTGLGLSLAKALAELLGGSVQLKSDLGIGSTFSVRLPVRYGAWRGVGRKVLIVDDDEPSRYVLKSMLAGNDFQISEAPAASDGIRQAILHRPDLIFLDLGLPDLDGKDALRALKQNEVTRNIPVIVHTSRELSQDQRTELSSMSVGVLAKNGEDSREQLRALLAASGVAV